MKFKNIKDLRIDNDKTQKEIASILNITQQQYSLYENGKRLIPIDKLIILKQYYGVTADYLIEKII